MKLCTRGLSTNLKAPIFVKNSKSASTVKWFQISGFEFPVSLSTISVRCTRSSVHVSSPVIQSDIDSSTLHIPEENLEKNVEKVIYSCRFFTILAVWGSLIGSFLCFIKGCSCVVESFQAYFASRTKVIVYLVEALDIYLLGTVMLVFGMGLYELFISNLDKGKSMSREKSSPYRSNLLGMFTLKERPRWLEITSVSGLKTKIGHVIVMLLLIGLFDKSKRAVINSPFDLLCFSASLLLCSACLYLLSKLTDDN
ncbi:uncharacterized protein LOC107772445 [Nicotiana tabacum]|uniref:Uncharacterized protein LOC107772445 n=1 Tax=Nicotiana tabacum TaxID=4097 RepID=A0A1S3Y5H6_TOBAC|nr:uncharacterized protein LOC104117009 [Nicotiana tomentosiformis]XP_016447439.1 PREDICTED: uncharacterized protein LOC107772445 [Nicotiana tabacum]